MKFSPALTVALTMGIVAAMGCEFDREVTSPGAPGDTDGRSPSTCMPARIQCERICQGEALTATRECALPECECLPAGAVCPRAESCCMVDADCASGDVCASPFRCQHSCADGECEVSCRGACRSVPPPEKNREKAPKKGRADKEKSRRGKP